MFAELSTLSIYRNEEPVNGEYYASLLERSIQAIKKSIFDKKSVTVIPKESVINTDNWEKFNRTLLTTNLE